MKIVLIENDNERKPYREPPVDVKTLAYDLLGRLDPDWRTKNHEFLHADLPADTLQFHMGFIGVLSTAYSLHKPIAIAPHDLWFIVLGELAKYVNANSQGCRSMFTREPEGKIEISIPTGDITTIEPLALIEMLRGLVPVDLDLFLPKLDSAPVGATLAMSAAFCDMVQSYYSYSTFMCGLPQIKLLGTAVEWNSLVICARTLATHFAVANQSLAQKYLMVVSNRLEQFEAVMAGGEVVHGYWQDIFRTSNIGSGGELQVNGWITDFFMGLKSPMKLENFNNTLGTIPYKNAETQRQFKAIYGGFSELRDAEGFVYTGYGHCVFEYFQESKLTEAGQEHADRQAKTVKAYGGYPKF